MFWEDGAGLSCRGWNCRMKTYLEISCAWSPPHRVMILFLSAAQESLSEPLLLSRLISICSEGRLSRRLFFTLLDCCSFCLIMAPHIFCNWESSSSWSLSARSESASSLRLLPREDAPLPFRLESLESRSFSEVPSRLHRPPKIIIK